MGLFLVAVGLECREKALAAVLPWGLQQSEGFGRLFAGKEGIQNNDGCLPAGDDAFSQLDVADVVWRDQSGRAVRATVFAVAGEKMLQSDLQDFIEAFVALLRMTDAPQIELIPEHGVPGSVPAADGPVEIVRVTGEEEGKAEADKIRDSLQV